MSDYNYYMLVQNPHLLKACILVQSPQLPNARARLRAHTLGGGGEGDRVYELKRAKREKERVIAQEGKVQKETIFGRERVYEREQERERTEREREG